MSCVSFIRSITGRSKAVLSCAAIAAAAQLTSAATFTPANSAAFTTALSQAQLGDTIILQAGAIYEGTFTLPNRTTGSGYITIQSSNLASLPATGTRVNLSHASNMPRIRPANAFGAAIQTATSAHHFKLLGLEITGPTVDAQPDGVSNISWAPIELGTGGTAQDTLAEVPNNIIIDRCIVRANSATQRIKRGIGLNSASTDITNCYLDDFKAVGQDAQAIGGYNGPGPFNIINNYIEGSTENLMFGGSDATIPNLVPTDIVVKRNHFFKPLTWKSDHPTYAGINWSVKNIFELKNARNVLVDGNIFENVWVSGQTGYAIVLTVRNQDGGNPWAVVDNVDFVNNIVRHSKSAVSLLGFDDNHPSGQTTNINISNNLIYDVGTAEWGPNNDRFIQAIEQIGGLVVDHNTVFGEMDALLTGYQGPHTGLVFTNNLQQHKDYGVISEFGIGNLALNNSFTAPRTYTKNVLMGGPANLYNQYAGNFFPTSWTGVVVNQASPGTNFAGWKVVNGSVYDNSGTDGKDIGVDIDVLNAATAGCISGVWGAPPPGGGTATVTLTNGLNGYNGATSVHVSGQLPTSNTGPASYYHVTSNLAATNGFMYRTFYKFDVSSAASGIPAGATITSARLKLLVEPSSSTTGYGVSAYRVAPVTGFTVNYATATKNTYNGTNSWTGGANAGGDVADSNNDFIDTAVDNISLVPIGSWLDFNVTSAVQAWVNGTANNGFIVRPNNGANTIGLRLSTASDLHGLAERATLEVTYETAPPSTTKLLKNGLNGYTGATSVHVSGQLPTSNTGPASYYHVTSNLAATNGFMYRTFYKFDVSAAASGIPAGATIDSARLRIKVEPSSSTSGYGVSVYRVAPVTGFTVNYATATKNTYNGTNSWTGGANAGGDVADSNNDFIDTAVDNIPLVAIGSWLDFNVTSAVQAWVNGTPNNGLIVRTNNGANTISLRMSTASDLHGSAEYVTLEVTYH